MGMYAAMVVDGVEDAQAGERADGAADGDGCDHAERWQEGGRYRHAGKNRRSAGHVIETSRPVADL